MTTFMDLHRDSEPQLKPNVTSSGSITKEMLQREADRVKADRAKAAVKKR
jgi:hypothetical protein